MSSNVSNNFIVSHKIIEKYDSFREREEILPYQISALMEVLDSQKIDDIKEIELEEQQSMVVRAFSKLLVTLSTVGVVGLISSDNEQINKLIKQLPTHLKMLNGFQS